MMFTWYIYDDGERERAGVWFAEDAAAFLASVGRDGWTITHARNGPTVWTEGKEDAPAAESYDAAAATMHARADGYPAPKPPRMCDGCGKSVIPSQHCTDDEVCCGTDDPGFFLCARASCVERRPDGIEARRAFYTRQRKKNERT